MGPSFSIQSKSQRPWASRVNCYLAGGIDPWNSSGLPLETLDGIDLDTLKELSDGRQPDVFASDVVITGCVSNFRACFRGKKLGPFRLNIPGQHNVLNALASVAVSRILKVPFSIVQQSLKTFRNAERRLQWKGEKGGVWVIDDYGHHPTEVQATLEACSKAGRRLVVIFQPHRYSRTQYLMERLDNCFNNADKLYLMDI